MRHYAARPAATKELAINVESTEHVPRLAYRPSSPPASPSPCKTSHQLRGSDLGGHTLRSAMGSYSGLVANGRPFNAHRGTTCRQHLDTEALPLLDNLKPLSDIHPTKQAGSSGS